MIAFVLPSDQHGGHAIIDLRGAGQRPGGGGLNCPGLAVDVAQYRTMGCSAWGVALGLNPANSLQQGVVIRGGGYAGRASPVLDLTRDETAASYNYDNEGRCGGWVLQLTHLHGFGDTPSGQNVTNDLHRAKDNVYKWKIKSLD